MVIWMVRHPDFFRQDREVAETDSPAPPLTPDMTTATD